MIIKPIKFDLSKFRLYEKLKAKQGDTESRFLLFQLLDGSLPFNLENRSVRAYMIKPDGKEVFNDLIINDRVKGYCTLELTNQVLAAPGIVKLELMVTEGTKKLTSSVFELEVDKSINSEKSIVSTNEFGALLKGLASLNEYDNYKNEIAEARGGQTNLKKRLDGVDAHLDNMANKAIFTFILDDVFKGDFLNAKAIFKKYNWVFNSALCPQRFWRDRNNGTCESKLHPYLRYQKENNMSLITHGMSHADLRQVTNENQVINEIVQGKKAVEEIGFKTCGFVPPNSTVHSNYHHYLVENYSYAFNQYRGNITQMETQGLRCYHNKNDDYYKLFRISLDDSVNSLEEIKSLIDKAIINKGFICFYDHNIGNVGKSGTNCSIEKLESILAYINNYHLENKCLVLSTDEAISKYWGINLRYNIIEPINTRSMCVGFTKNQPTGTNANDIWYIPIDFVVNSDNKLTLEKTEVTANTTYQFYCNIDVSNVDFNNITNHIIAQIKSKVITMNTSQDITISIEGRFMTSNTGLIDTFKLWYEMGKYEVSLFPVNKIDDNAKQLRVIFKIIVNSDMPTLNLELFNPIVSLKNDIQYKTV